MHVASHRAERRARTPVRAPTPPCCPYVPLRRRDDDEITSFLTKPLSETFDEDQFSVVTESIAQHTLTALKHACAPRSWQTCVTCCHRW